MGARWLAKVKKSQVVPKGKERRPVVAQVCPEFVHVYILLYSDSLGVGVVHLSPLGSQLSFGNTTRIENVADWESIAKKYRALMGDVDENKARDAVAVSTESIMLTQDSEILLQNNVNSTNATFWTLEIDVYCIYVLFICIKYRVVRS